MNKEEIKKAKAAQKTRDKEFLDNTCEGMSEIKYRAWDEDNEKMWYWEVGEIDNTFWHAVRVLQHIPMQYIGLKDKNGKEIYKGDIIKINHPYKNRCFIGDVGYYKYEFGCSEFYFTHFDNPYSIFSEGTEYIEVIGNIHENPELLKSNDQ